MQQNILLSKKAYSIFHTCTLKKDDSSKYLAFRYTIWVSCLECINILSKITRKFPEKGFTTDSSVIRLCFSSSVAGYATDLFPPHQNRSHIPVENPTQSNRHHKMPFSQQQTRSQARFLFQPLKKFNSDANFYMKSTSAADEFLQRIIVSFDMPFTSYKYALHKQLPKVINTNFNSTVSFTFFIKYYCNLCR